VELPLFSQIYEKYKDIVKPGGVYFFRITISKKDGEFRMYTEDIISYEHAQEKFKTNTKKIRINLMPAKMDDFTLKEFLEFIEKNKGEKELYFRVVTNAESVILKSESYKVTGSAQFIKGLRDILGEDSIEFS
jgi:DNA polymerase III alpha subunit